MSQAFHDEQELEPIYDARLIGRLLGYARPHTPALVGCVVLLMLFSGLALAQPYLIKTAIDQVMTPAATADAAGRFVEPQLSWMRYTGQGWPAHSDFAWTESLHPEDKERIGAHWRRAIEERPALYEIEGRLWHAASGRYRSIEEAARAMARSAIRLEPRR